MNKDELSTILENHRKWLLGDGGEQANLSDANLRYANLSDANLCGANLRYANLSDANLSDANLCGANLSDANLSDANLRGASLSYANLSDANLSDANLRYANLSDANLRGASLSDANLRYANLSGANLCGANLRGANLRYANLSDANLSDANLWSVSGNRNQIKSIFASEDYAIVYTSDYLQIGCERHPITEWWEFEDRRILEMDGKRALEFWKVWKPEIKRLIEISPASATGFVAQQVEGSTEVSA